MNGLHARAASWSSDGEQGATVSCPTQGGDHGTQKRQTSAAISQKTQSATPYALLRAAGVTQPRPRISAFPQHAGGGQSSWYRKDVGNHPPICGTLQRR